MAVGYKLEITVPATAASRAFARTFTGETGDVISIAVELKADKQRVSSLTVKIRDATRAIFNSLPDIAYFKLPVALSVSKPNDIQRLHPVFSGHVTSLRWGYLGPSVLVLAAHDDSVEARRKAKFRTFANLTSVQLARKIAAEYGYPVDVDTGTAALSPRTVSIGASTMGRAFFSDWDHLARELASDGLEVFMERGRMKVRQVASNVYPVAITPDAGIVMPGALDVTIEHIRGPGGGGQIKTSDPLGNNAIDATQTPAGAGDASSSRPKLAGQLKLARAEAARAGAEAVTHRRPVGGPGKGDKAHTEDGDGSPWTNLVDVKRKRKDRLTVGCIPLPDLTLSHLLNLQGWGAKIDGQWRVVGHGLAIAGEAARSHVTCERGPSKGSGNALGAGKSDGFPLAHTEDI